MNLSINHITKKYGKNTALDNVSMELEEGVYGLLGPNGAGKSTLMNLIVNDLLPSEGSILFEGKEIQKLGKEYRKGIGYMPQQQNMYEYFTGYRFLSYMAALKGMDSKSSVAKIEQVAERVNLKEQLHCKIGSYSGGMKQRLLIAQAILDEPKILILDEPTAGLDPKERIRIRNLISDISKNKIVIIATHVVQDIEYIANEIIMLKKGKLILKSAPEDVIARLDGHVFEVLCKEAQVSKVAKQYLITGMAREKDDIRVRVIGEECPEDYSYQKVMPTVEDCYLYEFEDESIYE